MYIIKYKDEDHYYYIKGNVINNGDDRCEDTYDDDYDDDDNGEGNDNNNDNNDNYIIDRTCLHTNRVRCFIRNHESLSMLG